MSVDPLATLSARITITAARTLADTFVILGTGSRAYRNKARLYAIMNAAAEAIAPTGKRIKVIEGKARGADDLFHAWAIEHGHNTERFPANWVEHRTAAGPIRNRVMIATRPHFVIAVGLRPGSGTADCVMAAHGAGIQGWVDSS